MSTTPNMAECPQHGGAFDCTPFCVVCEGNQEYNLDNAISCTDCPAIGYNPDCFICKGWGYVPNMLPCQTCGVAVNTLTWIEELGFCIPCQHDYFADKCDSCGEPTNRDNGEAYCYKCDPTFREAS